MAPPRIVGVAVGRGEAGAGKLLAARFALLREEVRAKPIHEIAERGLRIAEREPFRRAAQSTNVARQHRELRMSAWSVAEEHVEAVADAGEDVAQAGGRVL